MIFSKKKRNKPLYKKFLYVRKNIQNRQKLLKFKKQKWQPILKRIKWDTKRATMNKSFLRSQSLGSYSRYKFFNQNMYHVPRYRNFFLKSFKQTLFINKSFKLFYGNLTERYIKQMIKEAKSTSDLLQNKINTHLLFLKSLESRLDIILLRSHFVLSVMNARQLISHGHVFINETKVKKSAFQVQKGDKITFSKKGQVLVKHYLLKSDLWPLPPYYLQISYKVFQIILIDDIELVNTGLYLPEWLSLDSIIRSHRR